MPGYLKTSKGLFIVAKFEYIRFSKKDLVNKKITIFDTNILSDFNKSSINLQEKLLEFKKHNFLPVFSQILLCEFIKGLAKNPGYIQTKREIIDLLQELNPIWMLSHQYISAIEYSNLDNVLLPYKDYMIFASVPVEGKIINCRTPIYECNKKIKYKLIPYESVWRNPENWNKFLEELLEDIPESPKILEDGCQQNFLAAKREQSSRISQDRRSQDQMRQSFDENHFYKVLKKHTKISEREIHRLIAEFNKLKANNTLLYKAPFHVIYDEFYQWQLDNIKNENDIPDGLYAALALSYCDCFVTNENKLLQKCSEIIKKYQLYVKLYKFDPDSFTFQPQST